MIELNKIYLGDSLELLKQIKDDSVDLIVTDPPYIVDTTTPSEKTSSIKSIGKLWGKNENSLVGIDNGFNIDQHLTEWKRVLKKFNAFIFCSNKQISSLMKWGEDNGFVTTCLIWWKYNAPPLCNGNWISDIEYCIHIREKGATFQGNADIKSKVYRNSIVKSEYDHPTVKPLELIKKYILLGSNENDVILDPFCGSGTTVNACIQLKRQYLAYKIEPKYFKIAIDRQNRAIGNVGLFS